MKVEELTKKIYENFPGVWEKLKEKYDNNPVSDCEVIKFHFYNNETILKRYYTCSESAVSIIPFNMLYGLLEDFFEENGLTFRYVFDYDNWELYVEEYIKGKGYNDIEDKELYYDYGKTKPEAKIQAILKACEILEERIKK